ncbi:uncharacterized protein J3D65DRAFT_367299 [Phyllosticta citribraziliensis]|uniref:SRR1-like domain-containing protein n=1 Tax=Phyllosticta citribraziliensis TaxID=989973 RepID=A0ABR1LPM4_9PEZI
MTSEPTRGTTAKVANNNTTSTDSNHTRPALSAAPIRSPKHEKLETQASQPPPPHHQPAPSKSKQARIPLNDGWTLVSTTNKMSRFRISDLAATHTPNGPAPIMPGTSKEQLLDRFAAFRERWRESACVVELRDLLERTDLDAKRRREQQQQQQQSEDQEWWGLAQGSRASRTSRTIENAVVLGLGSLSIDNIAGGVRSMWQLVCFLEMVALLSGGSDSSGTKGKSASTPVPVYAEDPVFNALDEEVLASLGVEIVRPRKGGAAATAAADDENAGSARLIADSTFVFAPFMPSFVMMEEFLRARDPLVYVGNDIGGMLELGRSQLKYSSSTSDTDDHNRTRKCIGIAEAFLSSNRGVATMPDFDLHPHALAGQMIYWRKPAAVAAPGNG